MLSELNSNIKSAFPLGIVKMTTGENKRYIKITSEKTSYDYGVVLTASGDSFGVFYISPTAVKTVTNSEGSRIVTSKSELTTIIDFVNPNAHSFIILGGSLKHAALEMYS